MLFKNQNKKFVVREELTGAEVKVCKNANIANEYVRLHSGVIMSVEDAPMPSCECGSCIVYLALYEEGGCTLKGACYHHCYKCEKEVK